MCIQLKEPKWITAVESALKSQLEVLLTGNKKRSPGTIGEAKNPMAANRLLEETQLRIDTEAKLRAAQNDLASTRKQLHDANNSLSQANIMLKNLKMKASQAEMQQMKSELGNATREIQQLRPHPCGWRAPWLRRRAAP